MNKFEKVKFEEYKKGVEKIFGEYPDSSGADIGIEDEYKDIKLPCRGTVGSAGYDFFMPFGLVLKKGQSVAVPTGVKWKGNDDVVLCIYPRSGLGFKYHTVLANTVGIIDNDYYNNPDNEGHIFIKIINDDLEGRDLVLKKGDAFAQGIMFNFITTVDDIVKNKRTGGFGSTDKK